MTKDSGQKQDSLRQQMQQLVVAKSKFSLDEVLEKPETSSFIPDAQFKQMTQVPLSYAIYEDSNGSNTVLGGGVKEVHVDGVVYYRVAFSILGVQPINLFEVCQLYCANCKRAFSYKTLSQADNLIFDNSAKFQCQKCESQQLESIFMIQFLA